MLAKKSMTDDGPRRSAIVRSSVTHSSSSLYGLPGTHPSSIITTPNSQLPTHPSPSKTVNLLRRWRYCLYSTPLLLIGQVGSHKFHISYWSCERDTEDDSHHNCQYIAFVHLVHAERMWLLCPLLLLSRQSASCVAAQFMQCAYNEN